MGIVSTPEREHHCLLPTEKITVVDGPGPSVMCVPGMFADDEPMYHHFGSELTTTPYKSSEPVGTIYQCTCGDLWETVEPITSRSFDMIGLIWVRVGVLRTWWLRLRWRLEAARHES